MPAQQQGGQDQYVGTLIDYQWKKAWETTQVGIFDGRQTTPDKYIVPPGVQISGFNTMMGLDGRMTKLPALAALNTPIAAPGSILSMANFKQGTLGGHWWIFDSGTNTYAHDVLTGTDYLLRSNTSNGTWSTVQFNDLIYRTTDQANEMVLFEGAANGTTSKSWGIAAPATAPTVATSGTGTLSSPNGMAFGYCFVDDSNATNIHASAISPISAVTTFANKLTITLSALPTSANPRVTKLYFFGSYDSGFIASGAAAGGALFLLQDANGNPLSVTNGTTSIGITVLNQNNNVPAPFYNQPPPLAKYCTEYQNRVWFWGLANKTQVAYTLYENSFIGRREECVPTGFNVLTVPDTVTALGKTPAGLIIFSSNKMRILTGQVSDTIPSNQFVFGQSNLNIPNITSQLILLPFEIGTRSPLAVTNDPQGACWFLSNDLKVYKYNGTDAPVEMGILVRPDLSVSDPLQRANFRAAFMNFGTRMGYSLLYQRSL